MNQTATVKKSTTVGAEASLKTMKAARIHNFGDPDVFKIEDAPIAELEPGRVRIKILATGVNRLEHYIRKGEFLTEDQITFPRILGADAAGVIDEVADDVTGFDIGERVIPLTGYPTDPAEYDVRPFVSAASFQVRGVHSDGTYAQYIDVPAQWVLRDSTDLTPAEAATLPMVLVTAVSAVKNIGQVKEGDTILIQAGASGTGSMSIQVAKTLGARVLATVRSAEKVAFVESVGADRVIVTSQEDFVQVAKDETGGRGVDVVIDGVGGEVFTRGIDALRVNGVIVPYGFTAGAEATLNLIQLFFAQKQIRGAFAGGKEDLEWGLEQVKQGRIKPLLQQTFPLSKVNEAHRLVAESKIQGNLVLLPWE